MLLCVVVHVCAIHTASSLGTACTASSGSDMRREFGRKTSSGPIVWRRRLPVGKITYLQCLPPLSPTSALGMGNTVVKTLLSYGHLSVRLQRPPYTFHAYSHSHLLPSNVCSEVEVKQDNFTVIMTLSLCHNSPQHCYKHHTTNTSH